MKNSCEFFLTKEVGSRQEEKTCQTEHGTDKFPPSVCCGEKKAGGPIGTNLFGDSGFVVL